MFSVGTQVFVKKLKKHGEIKSVLNGGRYQVSVGSFTLTCNEEELRPPTDEEIKRRAQVTSTVGWKIESSPASVRSFEVPLDLHGLTVQQALEQLEKFIDSALQAGVDRIQVIHGYGSGAVTGAVHKYLETSRVVQSYKLAERNSGMTWIYL